MIAYVAVSLDGYIAHADGTVDFLDAFGTDEYDFHGFLSSIGALVLGATTYEQVLGWGWPYGELPALVLTSRELAIAEGADITFSSGPTGDAIRAYAEDFEQRVWVVGGGGVIVSGLNEAAVDTLELYVMPVALGDGVPLFPRAFEGTLTLEESQSFSNGVVKLVYRAAI